MIERGLIAAGRFHLDHCFQVGEELLLARACVGKRNHALLSLPSSVDSPTSPARNYNSPLRKRANTEGTEETKVFSLFVNCLADSQLDGSDSETRRRSLCVLRDLVFNPYHECRRTR